MSYLQLICKDQPIRIIKKPLFWGQARCVSTQEYIMNAVPLLAGAGWNVCMFSYVWKVNLNKRQLLEAAPVHDSKEMRRVFPLPTLEEMLEMLEIMTFDICLLSYE